MNEDAYAGRSHGSAVVIEGIVKLSVRRQFGDDAGTAQQVQRSFGLG